MIKLKVTFSIKHINIYLIKNKITILTLSTKNSNIKNFLFRTNNLSALQILSQILIQELKFSGINEPITFECKQFKGKIINFIKLLTESQVPILVKIIKN